MTTTNGNRFTSWQDAVKFLIWGMVNNGDIKQPDPQDCIAQMSIQDIYDAIEYLRNERGDFKWAICSQIIQELEHELPR